MSDDDTKMKQLQVVIEKLKQPPAPMMVDGMRGRAGRLKIPRSAIEDEFFMTSIREHVMSQLFIVRCEHEIMSDVFVYEAYSPHFRKLKVGETVPWYKVWISKSESGEIEVEFKEWVSRTVGGW